MFKYISDEVYFLTVSHNLKKIDSKHTLSPPRTFYKHQKASCLQPPQPLRNSKPLAKQTSRLLRWFQTLLFATSGDLRKSPASCGKLSYSSGDLF
ncbi:hypothetical protein [Chryseobacterium oranimense]|uniref:hypothetical protein n=1 Tax=Chryseobacterium oranimense TaxID=421058 RepID=UPI001114B698|nr:hypothetical protein [Chryseobacterium oranimense]